jgi:uncharacterized protein involved in response to NO
VRESAKSIATEWSVIRREPYRLFFPLGILFALGGVGHWLFYAMGWMKWYSGFLHANIQTQLYLACFVGGFLMTAVPRFSGTWTARVWELVSSLVLLLGVAAALFSGQWVISESLYALWLVLLARFIGARFLKRGVQYPPVEFVWIPPAIFLEVAGATVIILVLTGRLHPEWMSIGRSMQEQGFMLALVLGVGGFLGPRLMGVHQLPLGNSNNFKLHIQKKIFIHTSSAVLLMLSFFLEGSREDHMGYTLRAVIVMGMFLWTRSLNTKVIFGPGIFIRLLSVSYWMIALGYWLIPFFPKLHIALLHLVFLGGFSLMIYCVATMVVLNHAGRGELLQKPLWIFWLIASGVAVSLGIRLVATFFSEQYFLLLGITSSTWLVVGIGWLIFSMPFILRVPDENQPAIDHQKIIKGTSHAC